MDIGSNEWKHLLKTGAEELGILLEPGHVETLSAFILELLRWNRKINLTRIENPRDIAVKHILDSLTPIRWIEGKRTLLDIGSGGGFPGIPLKILRPELTVRLVDASRKRVHFLKHVFRTLKLEAITAHQLRAEDLGSCEAFQGRFDAVVSRAFSDIDTLFDLGSPLLTRYGILIAMKGAKCKDELLYLTRRLQKEGLPYRLSSKAFTLPHSDFLRQLVVISRV